MGRCRIYRIRFDLGVGEITVTDTPLTEPTIPVTDSAVTNTHLKLDALFAIVLLEVARRRGDALPGLAETLQDEVLITSGGTTRRAAGWFLPEVWRQGERSVHELFLNAAFDNHDPHVSSEEDVLVTLLHEACHVYAEANEIKDTSRDRRYHNRRFAEIAIQIGLHVEKDREIGHRTTGLSDRGLSDYADLLADLKDGLTLARAPWPTTPDHDNGRDGDLDDRSETSEAPANRKYVFSSCRCRAGRGPVTIRVARGSWRPGAIRCAVCGDAFKESLTAHRQRVGDVS